MILTQPASRSLVQHCKLPLATESWYFSPGISFRFEIPPAQCGIKIEYQQSSVFPWSGLWLWFKCTPSHFWGWFAHIGPTKGDLGFRSDL